MIDFTPRPDVVPCFTPHVQIATPSGLVAAADLRAGDPVLTRDNGIQPVAWVGSRRLGPFDLQAMPHLTPVLVRAGALGGGAPNSDMILSPNHRVLVQTAAGDERITPVQTLLDRPGIDRLPFAGGAEYLHFAFEQHEIVLSNGCWSESFQPSVRTLSSLETAQREEILTLFPELRTYDGVAAYGAAREDLSLQEAQSLAS